MNANLRFLCEQIFGARRFEVFEFLCKNADENGFVFAKIEDIMQKMGISKPTAINALKFLQRKKLLKKLKNGFYELKIEGKNKENLA